MTKEKEETAEQKQIERALTLDDPNAGGDLPTYFEYAKKLAYLRRKEILAHVSLEAAKAKSHIELLQNPPKEKLTETDKAAFINLKTEKFASEFAEAKADAAYCGEIVKYYETVIPFFLDSLGKEKDEDWDTDDERREDEDDDD